MSRDSSGTVAKLRLDELLGRFRREDRVQMPVMPEVAMRIQHASADLGGSARHGASPK